MGFTFDIDLPAIVVFLQGLLSFFSPCVLPLLPLYIGYLAGEGSRNEAGELVYPRGRVFLHTCCFVLGISFAFFLLGLGFSALGSFFQTKQALFARIGGVLVVLIGLYQLGVFGSFTFLGRERRLSLPLEKLRMSPFTALLLGFTFSFAWTPCVGPALTSVLLLTASAESRLLGMAMIGVYTLGFVIPFLLVGLFTTSLLRLFREHRGVLRYTVKTGGVLMVLLGVLMFTGQMNQVTGYLSRLPGLAGSSQEAAAEQGTDAQVAVETTAPQSAEETTASQESVQAETDAASHTEQAGARELPAALDFKLKDQYGTEHSLADYKGKTIFLNFWATWCPPCRAEMPDIQALYEAYEAEDDSDVVILGVAGPGLGQEGSEEEIRDFLSENGYTYPVLMDEDYSLFYGYGISAFPTTFMINSEGNVYGYVPGQLTKAMMERIIEETLRGGADEAE